MSTHILFTIHTIMKLSFFLTAPSPLPTPTSLLKVFQQCCIFINRLCKAKKALPTVIKVCPHSFAYKTPIQL